ncbi:MAG: Tol-Pal system beta propeller repeat protein TolB, partial [Desulfobacteraceae bacterium]
MMVLKNICVLFAKCILLLAILFSPNVSPAEIKYFDLTKPYLRKIPMAVPVFQAQTSTQAELDQAATVADKVQKLLEFTGYFKILDRVSFLYNPQTSGITLDKLNFPNWTTVGAELLITGGVKLSGQEMELELRLFDTFKAKLLVGRRYNGKIKDQRTM